jgi:hypothetical protein
MHEMTCRDWVFRSGRFRDVSRPIASLSRDGGAMDSHLLDDLAVPLLSSLSRGTEGFSDLPPRDPGRPSCHDGVNDLALTSSTSQRSTLEEVLLRRALVTFAGFVLLETLGEFVGVVKDVLN